MGLDKNDIKEQLTTEDIFELLDEFGGDPRYTNFGIISRTICHNPKGEGSYKLYYYINSQMFHCFTGCNDSFDVFDLVIKVADIQLHKKFDLNDAVKYVAYKFGITSQTENTTITNDKDWDILDNYNRIQSLENKDLTVSLKEYDDEILNRFNYNFKLTPWLNDNITQEVIDDARIGFYPGGDQITIPHFDVNNRFIGLRGRTLCKAEAELYGKYRPLRINNILYTHPLGMNLYNINHSKDNIASFKKAIIFESEKSCLQYRGYFGPELDISTACCGSSISAYQMQLLLNLGVNEVIIGFDRQFKQIGDAEHSHLVQNLRRIYNKYKNFTTVSFIFDKKMITNYKDSPTDNGRDTFVKLFNERIFL